MNRFIYTMLQNILEHRNGHTVFNSKDNERSTLIANSGHCYRSKVHSGKFGTAGLATVTLEYKERTRGRGREEETVSALRARETCSIERRKIVIAVIRFRSTLNSSIFRRDLIYFYSQFLFPIYFLFFNFSVFSTLCFFAFFYYYLFSFLVCFPFFGL